MMEFRFLKLTGQFITGVGLVVLIVLFHATAQEIVQSKSICTIRTDIGSSSVSDTVVMTNTGTERVTLDSARIAFTGIDTTRTIPAGQLYIEFVEAFGDAQRKHIIWLLDSVGIGEYRCNPEPGSDTVRQPLTFESKGDRLELSWFIIGTCYWCDAIHFFPFSEAVLRLFFSNCETVELRFVYEGYRVPVCKGRASTGHKVGKVKEQKNGFLINGRRVHEDISWYNRRRVRHIIYRSNSRR